MKSNYVTAASSFVLAMALGGPAFAEDATQDRAAEQSQMGIEEPGSTAGQSAATGESGSKSVDDIAGTNIVNSEGEEIGEVDSIVRDRSTNEQHAVVSVGGFLGIGDKKVTIPLSNLQMQEDQLVASLASKEELTAQPSYDESQYEEVSGDQLVELGGTGASGMAGAESGQKVGFSELDKDGDGYLSKEEAQDRAALSDKWDTIDQNSDDQIDRAEFSAFEAEGTLEKGTMEGGDPRTTDPTEYPEVPGEGDTKMERELQGNPPTY